MKIIKQSAHIVKDWPKMNLYERCEFAGRISHASEDKIKEGSAEEFVRRMVKLGHESVFEFARVAYLPEGLIHYKYTNVRFLREYLKKDSINRRLAQFVASRYPAFFDDIDVSSNFWNIPHRGNYWVEEGGVNNIDKNKDWIPVIIVTNRAISHQLVRYRKDVVYLQQSQRYVKYNDIEFISPDVYFDKNDPYKMWKIWQEEMYRTAKNYEHCLAEGYSAQAARLFLPNSAATKLIMYASPDTWRHVFEQRISNKADLMIRELLEPLKEEFTKEGLL